MRSSAATAGLGLAFVFAAFAAVGGVAPPLAAQQDTVRHVGELTGECSGLRGRIVQIDIQAGKLRGVILRRGGDIHFAGEVKDANFATVARSRTPVIIRGTIDGDTIRAIFDREECSYRAVLKAR